MVPWATIKEIVSTLGLKLEREHPLRGDYHVTDGKGNYLGLSGTEVILEYVPYSEDARSVGFRPRIRNTRGGRWCSAREAQHPSDLLLAELVATFAPEIKIPLPERVVYLPTPGWVDVRSEDAYASAIKLVKKPSLPAWTLNSAGMVFPKWYSGLFQKRFLQVFLKEVYRHL